MCLCVTKLLVDVKARGWLETRRFNVIYFSGCLTGKPTDGLLSPSSESDNSRRTLIIVDQSYFSVVYTVRGVFFLSALVFSSRKE